MNHIHHTAIIHPSCPVSDWGKNNYIGPYCLIGPNVKIGDDNRFEGHVSVGTPAEKIGFTHEPPGSVEIGSKNVFREFVTVNAGTKWITKIGDRCLVLRGSHVSHDTILEDDVTLANVLLGGESHVMRGANLGLGVITHQRSLIGSWSMLGMGSVVTKTSEIAPGGLFYGTPAKWHGANQVGLKRAKPGEVLLAEEVVRWSSLWGSKCKGI